MYSVSPYSASGENCTSREGGVTEGNTEEVRGGFQTFPVLESDSFEQVLPGLQGMGAGGGQRTSQLRTPYYLLSFEHTLLFTSHTFAWNVFAHPLICSQI